jgi:iron complex transport system substrate-binding protein
LLNVLGLSYGTQEDLERWITVFGTVLGRGRRAATLLSRMRDQRRAVGGRNAAASVSGQPVVNVEQVLSWNPDIILMGNFDSPLGVAGYRLQVVPP